MADGSIRIDTKLNTREMPKDLNDMEKMIENSSKRMKRSFESFSTEKSIQKEIDNQEKQIIKAQKTLEDYESKLNEIHRKMEKMQSEAYEKTFSFKSDKERNDEASEALLNDKNYQKLVDKSADLEDKHYTVQVDIKEAENNIERLKNKLNELSTPKPENNDIVDTSFIQRSIDKVKEFGNAVKKVSSTMKNKLVGSIKNVSGRLKEMLSDSKKLGKSLKNPIEQGTKSMGKMLLAIFSVRGAYSLLKKASSEYLATNDQLSNQIQGIWNAIAQAIGPVVEKIISWITTLFSYINSLIKSFTGIDLAARANAAAINKQAKATGNLAKEQDKLQSASFDEQNKLTDTDSNSSGSGGATTPLLSLDTVDTEGIKSKLLELFEPMKNAWGTYGQGFIDSFKGGLNSIFELSQSIGKIFEEIWKNGTGEQTCSLILQIMINIFNIVGNLSAGLKKAWDENDRGKIIVQTLWNGFNNILSIIDQISKFVSDFIANIDFGPILDLIVSLTKGFEKLTQFLDGLVTKLLDAIKTGDWGSVGSFISDAIKTSLDNLIVGIENWISSGGAIDLADKVVKGICDVIGNIADFLFSIDWFGILGDIGRLCVDGFVAGLQFIGEVIVGLFNNAINAVLDFLGIHSPSTLFKEIGNNILLGIQNGLAALVEWFSGIFRSAYDKICVIFSNIGSWFGDRYNDIKEVFSNIGSWFGEKFNEAWGFITSIFSWKNITNTFNEVYNGIVSVISKVPSYLYEKFKAGWDSVKKIFSEKLTFDNIKNAVSDVFKGIMNKLISGLNTVIAKPFNFVNGILNNIRSTSILGFKPFSGLWGYNPIWVPQIPKLARGGIVNRPTLSMIGEAGREAVIPLENNTEWIDMLADKLGNSDKEIIINVILNGKTLQKEIRKANNRRDFALNGG